MSKKITGLLLVAALCMGALGRHADAALFSLPKSLKTSPLDGFEMNLRVWGPTTKSFYCIQHLSACQSQPKKVALFSLPKLLKHHLDRITLETPTLGPMAHTVFCLKYPKECEVRRIAFRAKKFELTPERWNELTEVNTRINRRIRPERNSLGLAGERWVISPVAGDCNDYAVTKRHELLERGWPSRSVLLAEVVTGWGEHHLVVVVRTDKGDLVLDSLSPTIRPWADAPYRWARMQSPSNPKFWSSVKQPGRSA